MYTTATNPLVRTWRERAAIPCDSQEQNITGKIEELIFNADGTFALTWYPFELYQDYWGMYTYDLTTGQLTMSITSGNYIPQTVDLEGTAQLQEDGSIRLESVFFGQPPDAAGQASTQICGHIIE